ncbi:hypothetical protein CPB85DRAFT_1221148 [Mucidula mucida]|nr:hypothetical protein CPB85DRAFT_1221148 [Mucidula mucida]
MPPTRTQKTTPKVATAVTKAPKASGSTPGVSKLKASLRQTQRLLAKDNLAADVRVTTERRLKALESELAEAELSKKEQTLSARYHGVKFFERQKVTRKIKKAKKNDDAEALLDARVDLNYILHYPKLKKYISLFPPEVRDPDSASKSTTSSETDAQRDELRSSIRQRMLSGELPTEPEVEVASYSKEKRKELPSGKKSASVAREEVEEDAFFGSDDE